MPIYAYRCESCGFGKDVLQKISDPQLTQCPECGKDTFRKQVTAAGFQLKGSGWYVTDFRNGGGNAAAPAASAPAAAPAGRGAPAPSPPPPPRPRAGAGAARRRRPAVPAGAAAPATDPEKNANHACHHGRDPARR